MSFGVTAEGFNKKLLPDIQSETESDFKGSFGNDIDLDPREPAGQLKGIFDERIFKLWELAEAVYSYLNDGAYSDSGTLGTLAHFRHFSHFALVLKAEPFISYLAQRTRF